MGRRRLSPEEKRAGNLRFRYGITLEERDKLLANQGGVCPGCGSRTSGWKGDWHVDHSYTTGRVRGILCHSCNTILGRAHDSPNTLRNLIDYLEKQQKEAA